jgi:hypothetical protein
MKNRKTAYIMVPIVLAIWGMIGWKVYAAMKGKDDQILAQVTGEKIKTTVEKISDTISLIADYRDPFLGKSIVIKDSKFEIRNSKKELAVKVPVKEKIALAWPKVVYHGLIKRTTDQKTVGFLNVNGRSYFVKGGEAAGEVNVGKLWKDSVEIVFGKDKKVFRK